MSVRLQSLLLLHFTVVLFGFTGILGKYITETLPAPQLVWYRMLIAFCSIGLFIAFTKGSFVVNRKILFSLLSVGGIIALHWITFFEAIHLSNVSVPLACLASGAFFTAFLEPLFYRRKIAFYEVFLGLVVIAALVLIFKFETTYQKGIILSVVSAFLGSLFTVINGIFARDQDAPGVSFYEMMGGFIFLTVYLALTTSFNVRALHLDGTNVVLLLILGVICTGFAFVAMVKVMKHLARLL